ncbi:MAG: hypothetical protein ACHQE6_01820 [Solirubrobacterales bacterium]
MSKASMPAEAALMPDPGDGLFPAHIDTFGHVVLEAMAHRLPMCTEDSGANFTTTPYSSID